MKPWIPVIILVVAALALASAKLIGNVASDSAATQFCAWINAAPSDLRQSLVPEMGPQTSTSSQ
jgi:hypothetical protein